MTPVNGIIQRKLSLLSERVSRFADYVAAIDRQEFLDNWPIQAVAERSLQVAIETMIDIAERIIALHNRGPVASAADSIKVLVDLGVLDDPEPFASMVRFRNIIVHEYAEIDPALLYRIATSYLDDFALFRQAVDQWIERDTTC